MPAYRPLPPELTSPLAPPPAPPRGCANGTAVCVLDGLATIPAWQAVVDTCNADRARAALFGATDGQ